MEKNTAPKSPRPTMQVDTLAAISRMVASAAAELAALRLAGAVPDFVDDVDTAEISVD